MDDIQRRIAARRAEMERERAAVEAATKADQARRQAEKREAGKRQRADEEASRLRRAAPMTKEESDQLLQETIRKRWTGAEWAVVGITFAFGLWISSSYPVVGILTLLLSIGMYLGRNASHRDELRKAYPELFDIHK